MPLSRRLSNCLFASSLLAGAVTAPFQQAHAEAIASASLSGVQVRVIDLAPDDGVPAYAQFDGDVYGNVFAQSGSLQDGDNITVSPGQTIALAATLSGASSTAQVGPGNMRIPGHGPSGAVSTSATGGGQNASADVQFDAFVTLGPHSELMIFANATLQTSTTQSGETAESDVDVQCSGIDSQNYCFTSFGRSIGLGRGLGGAVQRPIVATWSNDSTGTLGGDLSVEMSVYAYGSAGTQAIAAVPEPSSWALLIVGLAASASIARRRSSGSRLA